jgi:hypothetical protein
MHWRVYVLVGCWLLLTTGQASPARPKPDIISPTPVQGTLTAPGNPPFHLKANFFDGNDRDPKGSVEIYWMAPDKWRRTIESNDFSQTLVTNDTQVYEHDSDDYIPVELDTLLTAMVDPRPILLAHTPGDQLEIKSNGRSSESGVICFGENRTYCTQHSTGLIEIVGTPGQSVTFTSYQNFKGKRIARLLIDTVGVGESIRAQITELKELKDPDESLFTVAQSSPSQERIRAVMLGESEFRKLAIELNDIIWPQVLDGNTTGSASFYVSTDRAGRVREVLPIYTDNERSNDSARRQIMKWKFKAADKDGLPAQARSLLTFSLNTRAWGPPEPLNDEEVRKLASNVIQPVFRPGTGPSGGTCNVRVAIDADGILIEAIPGEGVPGLFDVCFGAVRQWHFSPFMQDGQPRPYRAEIKFRIP